MDDIKSVTNNDNLVLHICDISKPAQVIQLVNAFKNEGVHPSILVNNAGVLLNERQIDENGIESSFATNTLGTYFLTKLMIPLMEAQKDARIITVSSGGAYNAPLPPLNDMECQEALKKWDGPMAYSYSKRTQIGLTKYWARMHPTIHFYCMHPGWVETPGVEKSLPSFYQSMRTRLRTPYQGIDTILWAAFSQQVVSEKDGKLLFPNGSFLFDRKLAPEHLAMAGTKSTDQQMDEFVRLLEEKYLDSK